MMYCIYQKYEMWKSIYDYDDWAMNDDWVKNSIFIVVMWTTTCMLCLFMIILVCWACYYVLRDAWKLLDFVELSSSFLQITIFADSRIEGNAMCYLIVMDQKWYMKIYYPS